MSPLKKQTDEEFDLQPASEFDLQSASGAEEESAGQEDKPWYLDAFDFLKGSGKQLANEGISLTNDLYDIGYPDNPSYSPERFGIQSKGPEAWGAKTAQFGQYLTPVGGEVKLGNLMQAGLRKGAIALTRNMAPSAGRFALRRGIAGGGNVLGRAAIGAGVGAGSSAIVDEGEGVVPGAILGGAFPGLSALGKETGATPLIANFLKERAGNSLAKAIQPGTTADKWALKNVLEPVLKKGKTFFSMKGLGKMARKEVQEAAERQKAVAPGSDAMVDFDEALGFLKEQKEKAFMKGRVGEGADAVPSFQGKESQAASKEFDEWVNEFLMPQSVINENTGQRFIQFDRLNNAKRYIQDEAAKYHAFIGVPEQNFTNRISAYTEASHPIRKQLEEFAGPQWAKENEIMSTWLDILNLARKGEGKTIGKATPLAERTFTGFGAHLKPSEPIDPSIVIRAIRHITSTPAWNSLAAQAKYDIAKFMGETSGFSVGQISDALYPTKLMKGATASMPESDEYEDLIPRQNAPANTPKRIRYNLEKDTFEDAR
jgi:hypothetical protein